MPATLDTLPPEVLIDITDSFEPLQKAHLSICNRNLYLRMQFLWRTPSIRHDIMRQACKAGDIEIMMHAIAHGQSKSFVRKGLPVHSNFKSTAKNMYSTLFLTAQEDRMDAFKYLLSIGADLKDGEQIHTLALKPVFDSPKGFKYLHLCFELGSEVLQKNISGFNASGSLVQWILLGLSASVLDQILYHNPIANRMMRVPYSTSHYPLGAALRAMSKDCFEVLLRHGASINGQHLAGYIVRYGSLVYPAGAINQPPVFDAIHSMIEYSNLSILEDVVNAGACLDFWGLLDTPRYAMADDTIIEYYYPMTPILYFLLRYRSWKPDLNAVAVIEYMVDQGARLDPTMCCKVERYPFGRIPCTFHRWVEKLTCILTGSRDIPQIPEVLEYLENSPLQSVEECPTHICKNCPMWRNNHFLPVHRTDERGCSIGDPEHRVCWDAFYSANT